MLAFDPVVLVLAGVMQSSRKQLLDHVRQRRCSVGDDLARVTVDSQGSREEPARGGDVTTPGHIHVDDLTMLVDRPVDIAPDPSDLDVGLVDEPAIPHPGAGPAEPRRSTRV